MRKTRFFQKDAYISVDFLKKTAEIVRLKELDSIPDDPFALIIEPGNGKNPKQIYFEKPRIDDSNAIESELRSFLHSIQTNSTPPVTINDGYHALQVAHKIIDKLGLADNVSSGEKNA